MDGRLRGSQGFAALKQLLGSHRQIDEPAALERRRRRYEENAVYVTDKGARAAMLRGLVRVAALLKANKYTEAQSHLEVVKHAYVMARYNNGVLKYRTTFGGWIAVGYLVLFAVPFWVGSRTPCDPNLMQCRTMLAILGGGLGGTALVILGILGANVQTSAVIHRNVWYIFKPISGCMMGLVTYLAVELGAVTLAGGTAKPIAVFLVGFLGGFFEVFANRALLKAAGLDEPGKPPPARGDGVSPPDEKTK